MGNSLGELRETELSSVDIGLAQVLVHAPTDAPYEWVRGRDVPKSVFPSLHAAHTAVARLWEEDCQACSGAFYMRSVPSVILHTRLGAVMVVDMWGDSKYRALTGKSGLVNLRINRSIGAIIDGIRTTAAAFRGDQYSAEFVIRHIGWDSFDAFPHRKALTSLSSCIIDSVDGVIGVDWIEESNSTPRAHMSKVIAGFLAANSPEDISSGREIVAQARLAASMANVGPASLDDVGAGIAQIEAFLRKA